MYLQKVICRKTFFLNEFFVGAFKVNDENSRSRSVLDPNLDPDPNPYPDPDP
jgi:hypothetical protein